VSSKYYGVSHMFLHPPLLPQHPILSVSSNCECCILQSYRAGSQALSWR